MLQHVQNTLCCVVTRSSRYSSITLHLKALHWLPAAVELALHSGTLLLTYKTLNAGTPLYFQDLLHSYMSSGPTRMSNPNIKLLATPYFDSRKHTSKTQLVKSFLYQALQQWNSLLLEVRTAPSVECFKERLKTLFLESAFST